MTVLRAETRFRVPGIWISRDLPGRSTTWELDGQQVRVELPRQPTDFNYPHESETRPVPAISATPRIQGSAPAAAANLVAVTVDVHGDLSLEERDVARAARAAGDPGPSGAFADKAHALLEAGVATAQRAVDGWISWVRATGTQPWLGIASSSPPQHGRSRLLHRDSDEPLLELGPEQRLVFRSGEAALESAQLEQIRIELIEGRSPPITSLLLNDASFLSREAATVDEPRALMAAAMACEIKAKEVLSRRCRPSAREEVDAMLKRTSNLPRLLDQLMVKATGRSLRDEDLDLHKASQKLFHLRNEIVHEGRISDHDNARTVVAAARRIVGWLDKVEAPGTESHR